MARHADAPRGGEGGRKPKIFVLDTNIILHDHKAIRKFQDNDLVIPIAVIEELDKFKKGNDNLAFNARGFLRDIDRITDGKSFGKDGVPIGKGLGNIRIDPGHTFPESMKGMFYDDIPDHRILATAIWTRDNNPDRFVALVTKDINLRMKAKAAGMEVQDYLTDRIEEARIENSNKEVQYLDGVSPEAIRQLAYSPDTSVDWRMVGKAKPKANQLYKIRNGDTTLCARFDEGRGKVVLVKNRQAYGIRPRNDEQRFALEAWPESGRPAGIDDRRARHRKDPSGLGRRSGTGRGLRPDHPHQAYDSAWQSGHRIHSGRPEGQNESVHPAADGQSECHQGPVPSFQQGGVAD